VWPQVRAGRKRADVMNNKSYVIPFPKIHHGDMELTMAENGDVRCFIEGYEGFTFRKDDPENYPFFKRLYELYVAKRAIKKSH
jgi:hypothetical protein